MARPTSNPELVKIRPLAVCTEVALSSRLPKRVTAFAQQVPDEEPQHRTHEHARRDRHPIQSRVQLGFRQKAGTDRVAGDTHDQSHHQPKRDYHTLTPATLPAP